MELFGAFAKFANQDVVRTLAVLSCPFLILIVIYFVNKMVKHMDKTSEQVTEINTKMAVMETRWTEWSRERDVIWNRIDDLQKAHRAHTRR